MFRCFGGGGGGRGGGRGGGFWMFLCGGGRFVWLSELCVYVCGEENSECVRVCVDVSEGVCK